MADGVPSCPEPPSTAQVRGAAHIISLVETCRRLRIEPFEDLRPVITKLAKDPGKAADLTPRK